MDDDFDLHNVGTNTHIPFQGEPDLEVPLLLGQNAQVCSFRVQETYSYLDCSMCNWQ